MKYFLI